MLALSCDDIKSHESWIKDIKKYSNIDENVDFPFPIIEDKDFTLAAKYHMVDYTASSEIGNIVTARAVYISLITHLT
jgi:alkyl hydroperoxide reductase subunit AhpC